MTEELLAESNLQIQLLLDCKSSGNETSANAPTGSGTTANNGSSANALVIGSPATATWSVSTDEKQPNLSLQPFLR